MRSHDDRLIGGDRNAYPFRGSRCGLSALRPRFGQRYAAHGACVRRKVLTTGSSDVSDVQALLASAGLKAAPLEVTS